MKFKKIKLSETCFSLVQPSELYCPNCGEQNVYIDIAEGDYYTGPDHVCLSCKVVFKMPAGPYFTDYFEVMETNDLGNTINNASMKKK